MRHLTTHIPPNLCRLDGEWHVEVNVQIDGETFTIFAPIGDGRYWAQQTLEKIILPALAAYPGDRAVRAGR